MKRDIESLSEQICALNKRESNNDEISEQLFYRNQLIHGISHSKVVNQDKINYFINKSEKNSKLNTLNF